MTYDQARTMARYLNTGKEWPDWIFPGIKVKFYNPEPDFIKNDGELQIIINHHIEDKQLHQFGFISKNEMHIKQKGDIK